MIKIENVDIFGWEAAIRGMRNPMNSWEKSDSMYVSTAFVCSNGVAFPKYVVGKNDLELMKRLAAGGSEHSKYLRMIHVQFDLVAPLYWWKEFDTYKISTVANSCSTMHKIHAKEFELDDFSWEHLTPRSVNLLQSLIDHLNIERKIFNCLKDKESWLQMIQLLPSSYNQRRTVDLNYQTLAAMYHQRRRHKLREWREFCRWIETLPYSELITGGE